MAFYRLFLFDAKGRIAHSRPLECQNDDKAIESAGELRHAHLVEIWEGARMVGSVRFPGGEAAGS